MLSEQEAIDRKERLSRTWNIAITPLYALVTSDVTGVELAARFVEKRLNDYCVEHGRTDRDTGAVEYPGNGEEYVYELEEIIEGIRALSSEGKANG